MVKTYKNEPNRKQEIIVLQSWIWVLTIGLVLKKMRLNLCPKICLLVIDASSSMLLEVYKVP